MQPSYQQLKADLEETGRELAVVLDRLMRLEAAVMTVVASDPAHGADYWGLAGHPTITGADCQQMAWARQVLREALGDTDAA